MGREQLQGTPWHYEQMSKTCKNGSKYCLYIRENDICGCVPSIYHKKQCVGKGSCEEFESKGNMVKKKNDKKVSVYHPERAKKISEYAKEQKIMKENHEQRVSKSTNQRETKEEKFLRLSKGRIDKIEEAISNLENLSERHTYSYTDEQVDKMFEFLTNRLKSAKEKFKNKKSSGGFEW